MLRWFLNKRRLRIGTLLALLVLAPLESAADRGDGGAEPEFVRARWLMGTVLEVRLGAGTPDSDAAVDAAFRAVAEVESAASLWRPGTELALVHERAAAGMPTTLSATLGGLVEEALRAAGLTDGAFSPAAGALVSAYDLRGEGRWPTEEERSRAISLCDLRGVRYDRASRDLRLAAGVTLDLDGIAKGFALDRAATALRARGVVDALLNFGGQLLSIGPPRERPAREALVVSPFDPSAPVLSVRLRNASLSTSANSERVRIVAGREAGHLLDPRTGELVPFSGSVSVLAPTAALADALSTAWAVEGPARFRRTDPDGPLRRSGSVAFALPARSGPCETVADAPFERLRPPARVADAAVNRP